MKKVSIVALAILLFIATGCTEPINRYYLSPPDYIQGTYRNAGAGLIVTITDDNFTIDATNMSINLHDMVYSGHYTVTEAESGRSGEGGLLWYSVQLESEGVIVRYKLTYSHLSSSGTLGLTTMGITQNFSVGSKVAP